MMSAEDHAETRLLTRLAKRAFPSLYEQRLEETRQEREAMKLLLPIFFYNLPIFPGEVLRLHLFEPRYCLMMKRIVDGSRRFAYVPNYSNYRGEKGDVALIAELKEVRFMRDGRSELEARIVGRYTIVESPYVEEGTGGLSYCRLTELQDAPPASAEAAEALRQASAKAREVAHTLFYERRDIKAVVVDRYGDMPGPHTPEALSLWIAAVLPTENRQEKHALLVCTDTLYRLNTCLAKLQALRGAGMGTAA
jgi:Lon protease-like protein